MTLGIQDIVEVRAQITPPWRWGQRVWENAAAHTDPTLDAGAGRVGVFASMTKWLGRSHRAPVHTRPPRSTSPRFPIPGTW